MRFRPFVINSNICTADEDISSYSAFMDSVACNIGNSYITWSLLKELGCSLDRLKGYEIKNIYTYDFSRMPMDVHIINNECTHVIIVLQDQIRITESYGYKLPFKKMKEMISKIKKPILVAGLGANSLSGYVPDFHKLLDNELIDFLRFLSDHCNNIGIRGSYTEEILHAIGINNVTIIGCPSYYETGYDRVIKKIDYSDFLHFATSSVNYGLETKSSAIFLQDSQVHEADVIRAIAFNEQVKFPEDIVYEIALRISHRKYKCFSSITRWKEELTNYDMFIGTRVHGAMIALNSGLPVVVMNTDSRAREMCEYLNIPYLPGFIDSSDVKGIIENSDYTKMNKEYNAKLKTFASFIESNGFRYKPLPVQVGEKDIALYNESCTKPDTRHNGIKRSIRKIREEYGFY